MMTDGNLKDWAGHPALGRVAQLLASSGEIRAISMMQPSWKDPARPPDREDLHRRSQQIKSDIAKTPRALLEIAHQGVGSARAFFIK
jgi:hypothetical protein